MTTPPNRPGTAERGPAAAAAPGSTDVIRLVARGELQRLLRDRKAVFFALVLPLLLYPLLFLGTGKLEEVSDRRMDEQRVAFAVDLDALAEPLRAQLVERLPAADGERVVWRAVDLAELAATSAPATAEADGEADGDGADTVHDAQRERAAALLDEHEADLLLLAGDGEPPVLTAFFRRDDEAGMRASRLVSNAARGLSTELFEARLVAVLGGDPAAEFAAETRDVALAEDSAGLALGRFLPLIAVLVVLSGGAFAALEAFAAEREIGTLETLLVQPVERIDVARGKLVAIVVTALASWFGNAASLVGCASAGLLASIDEGLADASLGVLVVRVGLGTLLLLPTVGLIAAVLGIVSARARSYREGQNYILPLTLIGMALAAPAAVGDVVLDPVLALVPILGPSLAMRDAVAGSLEALPALLAVGSSTLWAALALRGIASTLDAERLLQGADVGAEDAARRVRARRALAWGTVGVGAIVLVGGWLQSQDLVWGLVATLWVFALGVALLAARDLGGKLAESPLAVLGLAGRPPVLAIVGAALAGPGLARCARELMALQERFLPMPPVDASALEQLFGALLDRPLAVALFLIAVSPALCEELLFRGAVLRGLRADLAPGRAVLWQAALFGLAHASIYRLLPTTALGLVLGALRLRSASLWPCVALHLSYNASGVIAVHGDGGRADLMTHPAWIAVAAVGLGLAFGRRRGA